MRRGGFEGADAQLPRRAGGMLAVELLHGAATASRSRRRSTRACSPGITREFVFELGDEVGRPGARSDALARRRSAHGRRGVHHQHDARDRAGRPRRRSRRSAAGSPGRHAEAARRVSQAARDGQRMSRARESASALADRLRRRRRTASSAGYSRRTPRSAGTRRSGSDRRTDCRCARPSARTCCARTNGSGNAACSREYGCVQLVGGHRRGGVRRVLEDVVLRVGACRR